MVDSMLWDRTDGLGEPPKNALSIKIESSDVYQMPRTTKHDNYRDCSQPSEVAHQNLQRYLKLENALREEK